MRKRGSSSQPAWWRLRLSDLGRLVVGLVAATAAIQAASWVLPGWDIGGWAVAVLAAVLISLISVLLRPVLVWLAARTGWVGAILLAVFGQAVAVWAVFWDPDSGFTVLDAFVVSLFVSFATTGAVWLVTAGTDEAVTAGLIRRARRKGTPAVADPDVAGVVFVQADGVPFPVLELGVKGGTLPTLSRWVRSGAYRMAEWRPTLPATTPASQMGILHGTIDGIPAFRWLDRSTGRVMVANRPADAAEIEAQHSDGAGLLADDGVSISNLFTGDAPTAYVTMSAINRTQESRETRAAVSRFLARPDGLARGLSRTLGEVTREIFQANRAKRRDFRPRIHRGWGFAGERAVLNGVLRDLNTSLVAESMLQGRRSIYVDYVDYDAMAHHAGILRAESLDALAGIDAVLAQLEKVAEVAPRPYRFVVLSDHGQSQGEIFADRFGVDLATLVGRLADALVSAVSGLDTEDAGRLNSLAAGAGGGEGVLARAMAGASARIEGLAYREEDAIRRDPDARPGASEDRFLVFGSGNLGLVYVAGESRRLTLTELSSRFPRLVPGLVQHPGIGFVVVQTDEYGPVALGPRGEHRVRDGVVVGEDPLARFGPLAATFVDRAASMAEAPDLYVNSLIDEMDEVAAFEGLVGCHGGLGGWQDRAMIVWPSDLPEPDAMVVGADALHGVLVGWLEHLGHRTSLPARAPTRPLPRRNLSAPRS